MRAASTGNRTQFVEEPTDWRFVVHPTNNRRYSFGSGNIALGPKGTVLSFSCSQLFDCSHSSFSEEQVRTGHAMTLFNMTPRSSLGEKAPATVWPAQLKIRMSANGPEHEITKSKLEAPTDGIRVLMRTEKTYYGGVLDGKRRIVGIRSGQGWEAYSVSEAYVKEASKRVPGPTFGKR